MPSFIRLKFQFLTCIPHGIFFSKIPMLKLLADSLPFSFQEAFFQRSHLLNCWRGNKWHSRDTLLNLNSEQLVTSGTTGRNNTEKRPIKIGICRICDSFFFLKLKQFSRYKLTKHSNSKFEFFHNSCLIRQIQQKNYKKFRDLTTDWTLIACLAVNHSSHYTSVRLLLNSIHAWVILSNLSNSSNRMKISSLKK